MAIQTQEPQLKELTEEEHFIITAIKVINRKKKWTASKGLNSERQGLERMFAKEYPDGNFDEVVQRLHDRRELTATKSEKGGWTLRLPNYDAAEEEQTLSEILEEMKK